MSSCAVKDVCLFASKEHDATAAAASTSGAGSEDSAARSAMR
jgi:hypothetical protein